MTRRRHPTEALALVTLLTGLLCLLAAPATAATAAGSVEIINPQRDDRGLEDQAEHPLVTHEAR
jgi:hypothetical protein